MIDVHRQQCPTCGSRTHRNLLTQRPGRPLAIVVQCARCGAFVAHYVLSAYYHHGKSYEDWVRRQAPNAWSPRDMPRAFEEVKERAEADFEEASALVAQREEQEALEHDADAVDPDPTDPEGGP